MKKFEYIGLGVSVLVIIAVVAAGRFASGVVSPLTSMLGTSTASSLASQNATATNATASGTAAAPTTYPVGSPLLATLPLGDYKYTTTSPKKGYIYLCNVMSGGRGAQENGSWIHGTTWTPAQKVAVAGAVQWPSASYSMHVVGNSRIIQSNDLPVDLITGIFPIQPSDPAYQTDHNPNSIKPQNLSFTFPAYPTAAAQPGCIYGQVGIMNDGVELFDGFDAEYRDAVAHETQDSCDGHPDESGTYHYHGPSSCIPNQTVSNVIGFAFDGYPITGNKLPNGNYLTSNDLDECHGMTSTITLDGKSITTYHYVMTQDFPYSVSCFHGTSNFRPLGGGQQTQQSGAAQGKNAPGQNGTAPTPPAAAVAACSGKSSGASCTVGAQVTGTCGTVNGTFACLPSH